MSRSREGRCVGTPRRSAGLSALVDLGMTVRQAARQLGFAVSTAAKWLHWETEEAPSRIRAPMRRPPHPGRNRYHQLLQAGDSVTATAQAVGVTRAAGHK